MFVYSNWNTDFLFFFCFLNYIFFLFFPSYLFSNRKTHSIQRVIEDIKEDYCSLQIGSATLSVLQNILLLNPLEMDEWSFRNPLEIL